jgi:NAD(P)-dependent dehydrogenase (short-subunit alcohol dehydrogenase family)
MTILDRFRIDDRVAIVTGASSGLGVAFAVALAEAGADVSLGARREDRLLATRKLVEDAGRRAITVGTDVASPDDCGQLVDDTVRAFGRVDILVSNAGIGTSVPATREVPGNFDPSSISTSTGVTGWLRHVPG